MSKIIAVFSLFCTALYANAEVKNQETEVKKDQYFEVYGEYLNLQPFANGFPYVATVKKNPVTNFFNDKIRIRFVDLDSNPGFRLSASYFIPYGDWSLEGRWLQFHSKGNSHVAFTGSDERFETPWDTVNLYFRDSLSHGHQTLFFRTMDLLFGNCLSLSPSFSLQPKAGVTFVRINQKLRIFYAGLTNSGVYGQNNIRLKNDYHGVGLKAELAGSWNWKYGFSIIGRAAGSLVSGRFSLAQRQNFIASSTFPSGVEGVVQSRNGYRSIKAGFEASLGAEWKKVFETHHYFALKVTGGYEMQIWGDQAQLARELDNFGGGGGMPNPYGGDMGFRGFFLGAGLDF